MLLLFTSLHDDNLVNSNCKAITGSADSSAETNRLNTQQLPKTKISGITKLCHHAS